MDVQRRKGRDGKSRWQCRYRDGNGKRRARTFHSKREAERFLRRVHTDMERGDHRDPDAARQRFADLAAEHVANAHHLKPKTLHGYGADHQRQAAPAVRCAARGTHHPRGGAALD